MAKKRKSDATRLDEVDRSIYTSFCSAANSLSQLYTHSMNQQRLSFQVGERHALDKLYQLVLRQQEEGSRVTTMDIVSYLQNELEHGADEPPMSPRLPFQNQHAQNAMHPTILGSPVSSGPFRVATVGHGVRSGQSDNQPRNSVFSNALSSPVRRSIQSYHQSLSQGGYQGPRNGETNICHLQNRDTNSANFNDCMDMHADSPAHDFRY
ncbi:uncharacterized protein LOC121252766 [Juglans microcarpa x Juglans regia]|uniref:uncharacterized protein LOC121252766 n=1 Tax=Juglans microcarpa x Juglans regia TaxID=2249226 RepID=UPI001B7DF152|nr:uncharacterized protein LOC121252766 [Juglans microcarpa x Juglans regia]